MSREFAEKPQAVPGLLVSQPLESTRKSKKFPVFSLMIREFGRRDGFDRDCLIRHPVWHVSLHFGEAIKSPPGARFTRGRGPGECQRPRLSAKIAQDSLFAILACPSVNRPTFCGEASSGRTPDASNYARVSLSGFQSLLLRAPERGQ